MVQTYPCAGWSVKDVAAHLLGDEIGNLSRRRDGYSAISKSIAGWEALVAFVNESNVQWVEAARRISPRLLCDLIALTGGQMCEYSESLDPYATGGSVSWAGPDPAPVWLDIAREYTERWLHQQHIRDAVGEPGLKEPRYLAPVLDAFARALPYTYEKVNAADGTLVALTITGESGGQWFLLQESGLWKLYRHVAQESYAETIIDQEDAWRLFTKGFSKSGMQERITVRGDQSLGLRILDMVSIIA
ncbi:MAG: maleylpyruvate isomerase N-terminal domain-containing protein [Anaerolineae bacterium]|nr:maleylpyruvate isomerase N-terminal domain-containing protein [Anaerolineae bacterium]